MPFRCESLHINAFVNQLSATPTQRCALHFMALAPHVSSFHFLSMTIPILRWAFRFFSSANRFLSKLCHFLSTHIEAFSLLLDSAQSYASALLICANPLHDNSVLIHCLSVLNWATPLLFKSFRRISFPLLHNAGRGMAMRFHFNSSLFHYCCYASPMLASA